MGLSLGIYLRMYVYIYIYIYIFFRQLPARVYIYIDDLVQDCSISSALAMRILQSCTKPSTLHMRVYVCVCFPVHT